MASNVIIIVTNNKNRGALQPSVTLMASVNAVYLDNKQVTSVCSSGTSQIGIPREQNFCHDLSGWTYWQPVVIPIMISYWRCLSCSCCSVLLPLAGRSCIVSRHSVASNDRLRDNRNHSCILLPQVQHASHVCISLKVAIDGHAKAAARVNIGRNNAISIAVHENFHPSRERPARLGRRRDSIGTAHDGDGANSPPSLPSRGRNIRRRSRADIGWRFRRLRNYRFSGLSSVGATV